MRTAILWLAAAAGAVALAGCEAAGPSPEVRMPSFSRTIDTTTTTAAVTTAPTIPTSGKGATATAGAARGFAGVPTSSSAGRVPQTTTTRPASTTTSTHPATTTSGPPVYVHAGAFCSPEGATAVTSAGAVMRCTLKPGDTHPRWRKA